MLKKIITSQKDLFKINYKPIKFKIFKHLDGFVTLAINRWRLRIWGWWK